MQSWNNEPEMNAYNRKRIQENISVSEYNGFICMDSKGFSLKLNEHDETYYMSLHIGTSYRFIDDIWKKLVINFNDLNESNGNFVKGFDFSSKKTARRYYQNDYLLKIDKEKNN